MQLGQIRTFHESLLRRFETYSFVLCILRLIRLRGAARSMLFAFVFTCIERRVKVTCKCVFEVSEMFFTSE